MVDITERKQREETVRPQLREVAWLAEIRRAFDDDRFTLPGAFLPAAEQYGLIREIDRWVISRGTEMASGGMAFAVNLSGVSLADPTLIGHIDAELARTGADPSRLVFEITETALVEAADRGARMTVQIRQRGCRFALDDFGTGYGGFHQLKTLPLAFLKIDHEFVRDALTDESDRHVIWAVVNLAKGFNLKTVAEGVEDQATLDLLAAMDVDHAQGFHLGRPAPIEA